MVFDRYIESEVIVESARPGEIRVKQPYTAAPSTPTCSKSPSSQPDARNVLIVGGARASSPPSSDRLSQARHHVAEIDPVVSGSPSATSTSARTTTVCTRPSWTARSTFGLPEEVHIILLDAFTGGRRPFHMLTREFFELVKERLTDAASSISTSSAPSTAARAASTALSSTTFLTVFGKNRVYVFPKWYDQR